MSEVEEQLLLCYHKGCGQKYKASENTESSCRFHPGDYFFHDAYKGWTCCNRKTVDFTEFLNMKGCAYSFHSNEKPPEVEKKEVVEDVPEVTPARPSYQPMERPSPDSGMIPLRTEISESLKKLTFSPAGAAQSTKDVENAKVIPGETQCVNNGCREIYQGPATDKETCHYHPGVPIFHEGLKYWSCCKKRTTEFEVFMQQKGCTTSSHLWTKPKESNVDQSGGKIVKCREDWHETSSQVFVFVYAKKFDPSRSEVTVNGVKLSVSLYFPEEHGYFRESWILTGIIVPEESSVLMTPMKVEIKLKKAEPVSWKNLALPKPPTVEKEETAKDEYSAGVDALDLEDL